MHPGIEKLESLFLTVTNKNVPTKNFFDELWLIGATLPRPAMRSIVEKMFEFINSENPARQNDLATAKLALGFIAFHEGNYESSLIELTESQKIYSELNDEDGYQSAAVLKGCDYRTLGELELALKCLFDAYEQLSKTGYNKVFQVFCVYNLAEIYSETKQYHEALRFYHITEQLTKETGNMHMYSRALNGIGVVYQHQQKYSFALDYLTRSLNICNELKNLPIKARVLTDLGLFHFEQGDYKTATMYQEQAMQIRKELNIPNGVVTNMIHLAELHLKQNNPGEAISMLNDALGIVEEIKVKPKAFQIHLMLSEIYQSQNDLASSLFHYKLFYQIREEVQHEDNEKKIKNMKLIFEAEQTKKENAIIKAQKKEIEIKNIELQETIDELTLTRVSRKAKALTLILAIVLFIVEDPLDYLAAHIVMNNNYFLTILIKLAIILSLNPINKAIEHYLLKRLIIKKRQLQEVLTMS